MSSRCTSPPSEQAAGGDVSLIADTYQGTLTYACET